LCFLNILTRLLSNGWTDFHQIFTKIRICGVIRECGTPMKIVPPQKKKLGLKTSIFGAIIQTLLSSDDRGGILGKLKQVRQQDTNPPYGRCTVLWFTFYKTLVELMLSSNWRTATYRFRDILRSNGQHLTQYVGFGDPGGYRPQKGRRSVRDRYVPSCKISRWSVPPSPRFCNRTEK